MDEALKVTIFWRFYCYHPKLLFQVLYMLLPALAVLCTHGSQDEIIISSLPSSLQVTNRRVNALENVTIPRLEECVAYINRFVD